MGELSSDEFVLCFPGFGFLAGVAVHVVLLYAFYCCFVRVCGELCLLNAFPLDYNNRDGLDNDCDGLVDAFDPDCPELTTVPPTTTKAETTTEGSQGCLGDKCNKNSPCCSGFVCTKGACRAASVYGLNSPSAQESSSEDTNTEDTSTAPTTAFVFVGILVCGVVLVAVVVMRRRRQIQVSGVSA